MNTLRASSLLGCALAALVSCTSTADAPLSTVTPAALEALKSTFNAANGPRLVVFFSSACHACNEGSRLLDEMLASTPGDLTLIAVWEPIDPSDAPPPSAWLGNLKDPRVTQVWDPTHVFSKELRKTELAHPSSPPQARLRMDKDPDGILYDTAIIFAPGARWETTLPAPVYFDGGLAAVLPALKERLLALMQ